MSQGKNSQGVTLSRRTLVLLLVIVLLLVAGGITLGLNLHNWFGPDEPAVSGTFHPDLDPNAQDWTGETLQDKTGGESVGIKPAIPALPFRRIRRTLP